MTTATKYLAGIVPGLPPRGGEKHALYEKRILVLTALASLTMASAQAQSVFKAYDGWPPSEIRDEIANLQTRLVEDNNRVSQDQSELNQVKQELSNDWNLYNSTMYFPRKNGHESVWFF